jgi:hypothetical protein
MKKMARCVVFLFILSAIFNFGCVIKYNLAFAEEIQVEKGYNVTMKRDILCLMMLIQSILLE